MAKNWKVGEAVEAIKTGTITDKRDIGGRFPLFAIMAAQLNDAGVELAKTIPDYVTARKIECTLKGEATEDEGEGEATPAPEKEEVIEEAPKAKRAPKAKVETPVEVEETPEVDEYAGKKPKQLYDLCIKRGIEAAPKKSVEDYTKLLKKDDAAKAKAKATKAPKKEDDDWGEEDETPKTKKTAVKDTGKKAKVEEKEDDDWDI